MIFFCIKISIFIGAVGLEKYTNKSCTIYVNRNTMKKSDAQITEIFISPKMSRNYYFLSNDSPNGFYEGVNNEPDTSNRMWYPTVTHFIESKKFEGTQYEKVILQAKTAANVKRLTKERVILVSDGDALYYKKVYGTKSNMCMPRENWRRVRLKLLERAIRLKFKTCPKLKNKLLGTYPSNLKSDDNDETARILLRLRDEIRKTTKLSTNSEDLDEDVFKDVNLTIIRALLMKLSLYISKMEGLNRVFPEMVDDAIYNISPKVLNSYTKWASEKSTSLESIEKPNLDKYIKETRKLYTVLDPYQKQIDSPSVKIGYFILWCNQKDKTLRKYLKRFRDEKGKFVKLSKVKPEITIPHGKRWYRR